MGTYSIKDYTQRVMPRRMNRLKNMSAPAQASYYQVRNAISLAPKETCQTISGIRARKESKNRYKVESFVPGLFKQNMWANITKPFDKPRIIWNRNKPTVYGSVSANWTGQPGWFDLATEMTRVKFPQLAITELHKIMKE